MSYPNYPGGYPGYPGAPQQQQQPTGYPYPDQQQSYPGYPPNQGPYPPAQGPYPPSYPGAAPQPGYPLYPPSQSGYPQQYPAAAPAYPPAPGFADVPSGPLRAANPYRVPFNPAFPTPGAPPAPYGHHQTPLPAMEQQYVPSVYAHQPFDPRADADALYYAMKGLGTDEKALINVLCKRTSAQRAQITLAFKSGYGKDLEAKIKSETSGQFENVLVALTLTRPEFLARELKKAVAGLGTKDGTLIEILCSGTNQEIREINAAYMRKYGNKAMESDIADDTSGVFKQLLVCLIQGNREENMAVDPQRVRDDAQRLYSAGEGRLGTNESVFNNILATRSWAHLKQLMVEYQRMTGRSLKDAVASEFSANAEKGLLGILECAENRPAYFAKRLNNCIRGAGTKDVNLIRILVSRSDVDLGTIKQEYQKMYGRSLQSDVAGDCSGDYKHALLALIG